MVNMTHIVDAMRVEESIAFLKRDVTDIEIDSLISVLESLVQSPEDKSLLTKLADVFDSLGIAQGAVLTYAPYIGILLSENPFGEDDE